jgi:hypothetical protein
MTVEQFIADLDELAEVVRRRSTKKRSQSTGTPGARCRRRSFEERHFAFLEEGCHRRAGSRRGLWKATWTDP